MSCFGVGVTAGTAAEIAHLSTSPHLEMLDGEIEADESYFGGHRKGKRGRGAAGKAAVFGILKRQEKIFTVVVGNTETETLLLVIKRKIKPDIPILIIAMMRLM